MLIKKSEFIKSSPDVKSCPVHDLPEYAFTGRSNVGKSSLINYLTGKKNLAKTSSTPGKTRLINHFLINDKWYLVDLPGYGFAKISKKMRSEVGKLIQQYIENRDNLTCLFLLIDSRHKPILSDIQLINKLGTMQVPFKLVFTKCDKLSDAQLDRNLKIYFDRLKKDWEKLPGYFCTSVLKQFGRDEILIFISTTNNELY